MNIYVFGALWPMADNVFFAASGQETTWSSGQRLRISVSATKPLHAHSLARKMKIIEDALALAGRKDGPQRQLTSNHRQNNVDR